VYEKKIAKKKEKKGGGNVGHDPMYLCLRQTIFTLKIIVSIFVKLFSILVLQVTTIFYRKNFCEKGNCNLIVYQNYLETRWLLITFQVRNLWL
jgi:protein-S-isoprenylcysteine O-methyltransferase Ste14